LLVLLAVAAIVCGCRAYPGSVRIHVRNLSPGPISLVTEEPGQFILPNTNAHVIQPWEAGKCFAHLGLQNGHIKVVVSGSNIATSVIYETTTPNTLTEIGIKIDAGGHVEVGGTFPHDPVPCEGGGY
jgi:hypothetical protein